MEPAKLYFYANGGGELDAGNATVHAGNCYAAVVMATLGVSIPFF